jgi:hypothetical protein
VLHAAVGSVTVTLCFPSVTIAVVEPPRSPRHTRYAFARPLTPTFTALWQGGNALSPSIMVTPAAVQVPLAPLVAALPSGTPSDTVAHPTPQLGLAQSVAVLSTVPEPAVQVTSMGPSLHVVGTGSNGQDDAVLPPMPAPTQAKEKKRVYPSDVNPVFGTMTGVGRGSSVYRTSAF